MTDDAVTVVDGLSPARLLSGWAERESVSVLALGLVETEETGDPQSEDYDQLLWSLRTMLSRCARWQSLCGAAGDAATAALHVHVEEFAPGQDGTEISVPSLPVAVIIAEGESTVPAGVAGHLSSGQVSVQIHAHVDEDVLWRAAGTIKRELLQQFGVVPITAIERETVQDRSPGGRAAYSAENDSPADEPASDPPAVALIISHGLDLGA